MRRQAGQHHIDGLLMLLLFGVFAACVLGVLLTGARAYQRLTQRDRAAYERRICAQYIASRVRQGDVRGGVTVRPFGDTQALTLTSGGYVTRVYWHEGYLMELYAAEGAHLAPEDGERIMALEGLSLAMDGGLLTAEIETGAGGTEKLYLVPRSGEGAAG